MKIKLTDGEATNIPVRFEGSNRETMENKSLKILRVRHDLTQGEMAQKLNMSRQAYAKIENGLGDGNITFWSKVQRTFNISSEEMWDLINDGQKERAKV